MPTSGSPLQGDRDLVTAQHGRGDRRGGRSCHGGAVALHDSSRHPSGTVSSMVGRSPGPPVKPAAPVPGSQRCCLLLFFPALDASWDQSAPCLSKRCLPFLQICKGGVWMKICRLALSRPLVAPWDILAGVRCGGHSHPILESSPGLPFHADPTCVPKTAPYPSNCLSIPTHQTSPTRGRGGGDFRGAAFSDTQMREGFTSYCSCLPMCFLCIYMMFSLILASALVECFRSYFNFLKRSSNSNTNEECS